MIDHRARNSGTFTNTEVGGGSKASQPLKSDHSSSDDPIVSSELLMNSSNAPI